MAHSPELTLSCELFEELAAGLVARSDSLQDSWELHSAEGETHFLVKKKTLLFPLPLEGGSTQAPDNEEESKEEDSSHSAVEDSGDCAQLLVVPPIMRSVCMEYHVVYSPAYSVPVLYFRASHPKGKQLSLDQVWSLVSQHLPVAVEGEQQDYWGLVTQNEHPLLGQPFYHIHPCHTAKVMATVPSEKFNYLVTWLSVFGAVVGLKLPRAYINTTH